MPPKAGGSETKPDDFKFVELPDDFKSRKRWKLCPFRAWTQARAAIETSLADIADTAFTASRLEVIVTESVNVRALFSQSGVRIEQRLRSGMKVATRGAARREIVYRPVKASSLVSTFTIRPPRSAER